jgi:hypothetical protein
MLDAKKSRKKTAGTITRAHLDTALGRAALLRRQSGYFQKNSG